MKNRKSIHEWSEEDRPREKLLRHGPSALSTAELLAIVIGSGSEEESAVELMRRVMDDCEQKLSILGKQDIHQLCAYKGIGPAKAVSIMAVAELGKRRQEEPPLKRPQLLSSESVYRYFHPLICDAPVEECWAVYLNQASYVIGSSRISQGGISTTLVDVRCVLREALLQRATGIILCHNHPSGNFRPSVDDDKLTQALFQAAKTIHIRLLDHLILTDGGYYSYNDEGRLG